MTDTHDPKAPDPDRGPDRGTARDRDVDEIVQHTDSGSGNPQRERWPPNVDQPNLDSEAR